MKHYTNKEIEDFIRETWTEHQEWGDSCSAKNIEIVKNEPKNVEIRIWNEYDAPGLGFTKLKAVSDFFNTTNIDDPETFRQGGCETCDYGSVYGFTLVMKPDKVTM